MRWCLPIMMAAGLVLAAAPSRADEAPASNPHNVPEPKGLYQGPIHGYTPTTLSGGTVLDSSTALAKLIKQDHPVLVDVSDKDRKPPSMAPGMIWSPQHLSIAGASWLPGAGSATANTTFASDFQTQAASLTKNDKAKPIVVFCHPDCWASYNAAKRLIELGYTKVYWYPGGIEGWQVENDNDMSVIQPDEAWLTGLPKALTQ